MQPSPAGQLAAELDAIRAGVGVGVIPRTSVVALQAEGLQRWINGMFTHKYTELPDGQGRRSVIVDDRGRVQGLVDWYQDDPQHYVGVLEGVDHDWFADRFKMFLILEDIELDELDQDLVHLCGPGAEPLLGTLSLPVPAGDHDHLPLPDGGRVCRRDRTGLGGFDLLVPAGGWEALWTAATAAGATNLRPEALDALRILAGKAAWPQDGTDKSMVHELGYNVDCCSFDKGCYLGQEVINRIERRGGVRKKLTRLALEAPVPVGATVQVGDELVGPITSVTQVGSQAWALGMLREAAWQDGVAVTVGEDGVTGRVSLPG